MSGSTDMVEQLLMAANVNVNLRGDSRILTPLICAARFGREGMVKALLETGKADGTVRDNGGKTAVV